MQTKIKKLQFLNKLLIILAYNIFQFNIDCKLISKPSRDQGKLGKFYPFEVTAEKLQIVQQKARKMYFKHFRNAFIFGFCIELMITKSRIYENIVHKSTQRRLESKKKEDDNLKESIKYQQQK